MKMRDLFETPDLGGNYTTDLVGLNRVITKSKGIGDVYFRGKKINMQILEDAIDKAWDKFGPKHIVTYRFDGSDLLVSWDEGKN